jgi:hypothetical protein
MRFRGLRLGRILLHRLRRRLLLEAIDASSRYV